MDKSTVLNRVYAANLPSRAKTVMFYLVNRSNKEFTCFPAVPTIAKETGLSERTVQRALKELCEYGYIERKSRYRENGGQSSNLFVLLGREDAIENETCKINAKDTIMSNRKCQGSDDRPSEITNKKCHENTCRNYYYKAEMKISKQLSGEMESIDFLSFCHTQVHNGCHRVSDNEMPP